MPRKRATAVQKIAKLMRELDFCMLTTHTWRGGLHVRPMSNNGEAIVLIKVTPTVVSYWTKGDAGELRIR